MRKKQEKTKKLLGKIEKDKKSTNRYLNNN